MGSSKQAIIEILNSAGIRINGRRPYDIQVHDEKFYERALSGKTLGAGETYMDGLWSVKRLDVFFEKLYEIDIYKKLKTDYKTAAQLVVSAVINMQSIRRARQNISHHYDVGNDLYELMLDKRMIYSCAYWSNAKNLDEAQEAKLDLICRKLYLKPGMSLLDIGCGWGGLAEYAARKYKVKVVGVTISSEQYKTALKKTRGLNVVIMKKDFRELSDTFDRIVSVGMLEHVGVKNYKKFFETCDQLLKKDGLMLHHTIGNITSVKVPDPWMSKYIFPGGIIPSLSKLTRACESKFIIEDIHNFGPDYDKTLMAWHANFKKNYFKIKHKYDQRFYRMWEFYLLSCAANFRTRKLQLWQIVMRKPYKAEKYISVR